MRRELSSGYTTGTCAAAATRGALLCLLGKDIASIILTLPCNLEAVLEPLDVGTDGTGAFCEIRKDAGDDPDVTNGAIIRADVRWVPDSGIHVKGGRGVGVVTKPGLPVAPGMPAINPVPMQMIRESALSLVPEGKGVEVVISVYDGEKIAKKTLNPRLGIEGGISILGTTGLVIPYCREAYLDTIRCALDVAAAVKVPGVVLCTGRSSERAARTCHIHLPDQSYVLMGDYFEVALKEAFQRGFSRIIVACYPGKLLKMASGASCTHAAFSPLDFDFFLKMGANAGLGPRILKRIWEARTVRHAVEGLTYTTAQKLCAAIAEKVLKRIDEIAGCKVNAEILVVGYDDKVLVRVVSMSMLRSR